MKYFTINGRKYRAVEPDFNFMADYADSLKNTLKSARAYLAFCSGMTVEEAGLELSQHMINDGDLKEILTVLSEEIAESDFFRKITKGAEEDNTENPEQEERKETRRKRTN